MLLHIFYNKKPATFFLYAWFLAMMLPSCQNGDLDMGSTFIHSSTYTELIDTVTIEFSSFKEDSVITSGTGSALIGYYQHPILGGQSSKSYFQLKTPAGFAWDEDEEVLDSLVLKLQPNGYWEGDTMQTTFLKVHELDEKMLLLNADGKKNETTFYNVQSFKSKPEAIGQYTYKPRPTKGEELEIRLSNEYAKKIIDFMVDHKDHESKSTLFEDEFKGLLIECDSSLTSSLMGYEITDSACHMRLYSHIKKIYKNEREQVITLATGTQFNSLQSNNSNVLFNQLEQKRDVLGESETQQNAILQSGTGLKIRIDFPTLNNILELKNEGTIIKAQLMLRPNMKVMDWEKLPSNIYFGYVDKINNIEGYMTDANNNNVSSTPIIDKKYDENTIYTVDITNYINSRLANEAVVDTDKGIVITLPDGTMGSTYNNLVLNGHEADENKSELLLYYYYYDAE
jgi:hypothetical protein